MRAQVRTLSMLRASHNRLSISTSATADLPAEVGAVKTRFLPLRTPGWFSASACVHHHFYMYPPAMSDESCTMSSCKERGHASGSQADAHDLVGSGYCNMWQLCKADMHLDRMACSCTSL